MRQNAATARLWAWGKRHLLKALVAALAVLSVALAVVMASEKPGWALYLLGLDLLGPEDATRKTRAIELIGIAMGGALLAIGATIANRRAVAMENAARAQAAAAAQQAKANKGAEDGRRQERLKTAIEHLGHKSDSVRLGGAYELFHLAQDNEDLRQTALDILCAHIRWTTGRVGYREEHKGEPSTEVQSLLNLLFMQEHEVFKGCHIDLQRSRLNGADLRQVRLQGASLMGARLQNALLIGAHLQDADLFGVHLQDASLLDAYLQGARFSDAHLQRADLVGAQLQGARLSRAHLQGANLSEAHLQGANLSEAHLQGANLSETHLQEANLSKTHLQGVTSQFEHESPFGMRIHDGIGRESDLSGAIFAGGLSRDDVASLVEGLTDIMAKILCQMLEPHIGEPANHELPEGCSAITGTYTAEDAERWIAEYRQATGRG